MRNANILVMLISWTLVITPTVARGADDPGVKTQPSAADTELPPDADTAKERLDRSTRHGEWIDVQMAEGPAIKTFVVYPERATKAPIVIVIHEIFGLTDWVRGV